MVVVIWCGWMDSLVVMCCMILSVMVFVMLWMVCLFVEIVVWVGRFGVVGCLVGLMGQRLWMNEVGYFVINGGVFSWG